MKKKQHKAQYFVKDSEGIFVVKEGFFNKLKTRREAIGFGVQIYIEIKRLLVDEALSQDESFIGSTRVVIGLEQSLTELNKRFPFLLEEIQGLDWRCDGQRIFRA